MNRNTYIQITSGRGPGECTRVVFLVMHKLLDSAKKHGLALNLVDYEPGLSKDCMFSCMLCVQYDNVDPLDYELNLSRFKNEWEGPVLWVAQKNPFRPNHKRKNWYVGVSFFKFPEEIKINDSDIVYEALRSSGPGGQNVNKVETAVRATYKPTNLSVVASDERSQIRNKDIARERLLSKLAKEYEISKNEKDREIWMNHNLLERGNPVKKFIGNL